MVYEKTWFIPDNVKKNIEGVGWTNAKFLFNGQGNWMIDRAAGANAAADKHRGNRSTIP